MLRHQAHQVHQIQLAEDLQGARVGAGADRVRREQLPAELDESAFSVADTVQRLSKAHDVDDARVQAFLAAVASLIAQSYCE